MADFIKGQLEALGVTVRLVPLGKQILDGQEVDLPPAILASIGNDPKKKTVGLYAHYDVQPVSLCLVWVELATDSAPGRRIRAIGPSHRWVGHRSLRSYHRPEDRSSHRPRVER